ncbi:MAG: VWA domain-containing protein, partial [Gammaproteobacteria bacterium]|nr:VWA domain-containing protein [Gammaproteobacteria bacterium]
MNKLSARFLSAGFTALLLLATVAEGAPQKDFVLVLDNSGSMRKNDPQFLARGAVESFIEKLDADSRAGVLIFDQGVKLAVPLTAINDESKAILVGSLDGINYRG